MNIFNRHMPNPGLIDGNVVPKTYGFSPKEVSDGLPNPIRVACALAQLDPNCSDEVWAHRRIEPLLAAAWIYPQYKRDFRYLACHWTFGRLHGTSSIRDTDRAMDEIEAISAYLKREPAAAQHGIGTIYLDAAHAERVTPPDTQCSVKLRVDAMLASIANL